MTEKFLDEIMNHCDLKPYQKTYLKILYNAYQKNPKKSMLVSRKSFKWFN